MKEPCLKHLALVLLVTVVTMLTLIVEYFLLKARTGSSSTDTGTDQYPRSVCTFREPG